MNYRTFIKFNTIYVCMYTFKLLLLYNIMIISYSFGLILNKAVIEKKISLNKQLTKHYECCKQN